MPSIFIAAITTQQTRKINDNKTIMKNEDILQLFERFEQAAIEIDGVECWSARDLCGLLGYAKWSNFETAIAKAKIACESAGMIVSDHFPGVGKMVELGSGSVRRLNDYLLTRYAYRQ